MYFSYRMIFMASQGEYQDTSEGHIPNMCDSEQKIGSDPHK